MKKNSTLRYAFYASLPVMAGYLVLGIGFGVLLQDKGYGWWWAALSIAFFETEITGMAFGVLAGLFLDFGMNAPFGFHALLLGALCWLLGLLAAELIRTNLLTALLAGALGVFLVLSLQWLFLYLLAGYGSAGYAYTWHYLPRMGYSFVFMPITYYFNRALALFLRERE